MGISSLVTFFRDFHHSRFVLTFQLFIPAINLLVYLVWKVIESSSLNKQTKHGHRQKLVPEWKYLKRPFHGFFNFWQNKLGKIRRHHWKENLNISNIAKFESDTSLASKEIALQSFENLHSNFCMVGDRHVCPHHTNVCKILRLWRAVSSLVFNKSISNLVILLILTCPCQKLKKPCKGLYCTSITDPRPVAGSAAILRTFPCSLVYALVMLLVS